MKNLFRNLMMMTAVSSMVLMYSCGDEDPETPAAALPTISVSTTVNGATAVSPLDVVPGDSVGFAVSIEAEGGFNTYRVYSSVNGGDATELADNTRTVLGVEAGTTEVQDAASTIIEASAVGAEIVYEFEVVDDEGQIGTTSVIINVTSPEARVYSAFLLTAPLANDPDVAGDQRSSLTFYSTNLGERISAAQIVASEASSSDVDFGFYYLRSAGLSLAAPADYPSSVYDLGSNGQNWSSLNSTLLRTTSLDASAFAELSTFTDINEVFDAATDEAGMKIDLQVGSVLAFATDASKDGGSKRGVILVTDIVDANGNGDYWDENDGIEIEVIVQEDSE